MSELKTDPAWWKHGIIYQIYPRSFGDADGDGVGDLQGIIRHLDYLNDGTPNSLGIDAIWLSPVYPSPFFDFGYDVSDYRDIDPLFGSLEDFDRLVEEAHRRGIRIVMDLVMNHTSHRHQWFIDSRSSRDNPKRDWYIWRDAPRPGTLPNNWQSVFGGPAWEWDPGTGQYYLHTFLKEQPDLNWRNPQVRNAMLAMIRFWLDRGVDGFRLDVFNAFYKHPDLLNNPPKFGIRAFDRQHHMYDKDQPEMHDFLREFRALLDSYPGRMSVGELWGADPQAAAKYMGPDGDQLHLVFNFKFLRQPWRPGAFQRVIQEWEAAVDPNGWPCYVLSNHDVWRHFTRYGWGRRRADHVAKVAATLLLTLRGTPFLYYGEEIGMGNGSIPRSEIVDPPGKRYWPIWSGRDPARTPMQWNADPNAGFTAGKPWLRVHSNYATRNVEVESCDPDSVLNYYRRLIWLRRRSPALQCGEYQPLIKRPLQGMAYLRRTPGQTILVALNFFRWPVKLKLDEPLPHTHWRVRLTNYPDGPHKIQAGRIVLQPYEACVLEAEK